MIHKVRIKHRGQLLIECVVTCETRREAIRQALEAFLDGAAIYGQSEEEGEWGDTWYVPVAELVRMKERA